MKRVQILCKRAQIVERGVNIIIYDLKISFKIVWSLGIKKEIVTANRPEIHETEEQPGEWDHPQDLENV
jgi:hypothetical protein